MYHIVICDDEPIFLTQISEMIIDILASMGESCENVSVTLKTKFPLSSFPAVRNLYSMHILLNL